MNIRDIARLANVTPGTVSKVLNNYPDISEATRQHVLQIIKENQYTTKNGGRKFKQALQQSGNSIFYQQFISIFLIRGDF